MEKKIALQNNEALLDAFKIEELEERLETAPWSGPCLDCCSQPGGNPCGK